MSAPLNTKKPFRVIICYRKYHNSPPSHRTIEGDIASADALSMANLGVVIGKVIEFHSQDISVITGISVQFPEASQSSES